MINYIKETQTMELACDICPESEEYDGTWTQCIDQARSDGWKFVHKMNDWFHGCSDECGDKI